MLSSIVKRYMRDQVKTDFGLLKNSGEIFDKLKARDFNATISELKIIVYHCYTLATQND